VLQKSKLAASLRSPEHEDFVDASVRQFCANAKARLQACADEEDRRTGVHIFQRLGVTEAIMCDSLSEPLRQVYVFLQFRKLLGVINGNSLPAKPFHFD